MSNNVVDAISIIGSFLSLIGVIIAIVQVRKTLQAARAAERASIQAQTVITRNVLLADVSTAARALEELKGQIRSSRFEAALLRVTDLSAQMIQLKGLPNSSETTPTVEFGDMLTQLAILRELLERKLSIKSTDVDPVQVNTTLADISDQLNTWIGQRKYALTKESNDANT